MDSSNDLHLRWEEFQTNIQTSYAKLSTSDHFSDVTLVGEDGYQIKSHRVILSAASQIFESMLMINDHPKPMIFMRGTTTLHLNLLMSYIYHGEVQVGRDDLEDFLEMAGELEIKGLITNKSSKTSTEAPRNKSRFTSKETSYETNKSTNSSVEFVQLKTESIDFNLEKNPFVLADTSTKSTINNRTIEELDDTTNVNLKQRPYAMTNTSTKSTKTNKSSGELDDTINSMLENLGEAGQYACKVCGKSGNQKQKVVSHIEGNHIQGVSHTCKKCTKTYKTRECLRVHVFRFHKT